MTKECFQIPENLDRLKFFVPKKPIEISHKFNFMSSKLIELLKFIGLKLEHNFKESKLKFITVPVYYRLISNNSTDLMREELSKTCEDLKIQVKNSNFEDIKKHMLESFGQKLCSKSCRGAIKFGDKLSNKNLDSLIKKLIKNCKKPFQCAHGRPGIFPMFEVELYDDKKATGENICEKIQRKCDLKNNICDRILEKLEKIEE